MAEVPYFIPNLAFNSWVWYSKFLIDEEALFFSRNDRGDLRKIRNIWEDVHKSKINYFAGIWIPDTSINSFVHLLLFKENNFLPSHSHVWQRTEIFPFPWEKLFLKVPMYSSKRLAKYQNLTKAKKENISVFLETSPNLLLRKNLCQITAQNGPMVRIFKSKSEVLACTEKKRSQRKLSHDNLEKKVT